MRATGPGIEGNFRPWKKCLGLLYRAKGVSPEQDLPWLSGSCLGDGGECQELCGWNSSPLTLKHLTQDGKKMPLSTGNPELQQYLKTTACVSSLKELSTAHLNKKIPTTINENPTWPQEVVTCISCDTLAIGKCAQKWRENPVPSVTGVLLNPFLHLPGTVPSVRLSWTERSAFLCCVLAETQDCLG